MHVGFDTHTTCPISRWHQAVPVSGIDVTLKRLTMACAIVDRLCRRFLFGRSMEWNIWYLVMSDIWVCSSNAYQRTSSRNQQQQLQNIIKQVRAAPKHTFDIPLIPRAVFGTNGFLAIERVSVGEWVGNSMEANKLLHAHRLPCANSGLLWWWRRSGEWPIWKSNFPNSHIAYHCIGGNSGCAYPVHSTDELLISALNFIEWLVNLWIVLFVVHSMRFYDQYHCSVLNRLHDVRLAPNWTPRCRLSIYVNCI